MYDLRIGSDQLEQVFCVHLERAGEAVDVVEAYVAPALFNAADVCPVDTHELRELLLTQLELVPSCFDTRPKSLPLLALHRSHGGTLLGMGWHPLSVRG